MNTKAIAQSYWIDLDLLERLKKGKVNIREEIIKAVIFGLEYESKQNKDERQKDNKED